MSDALSQLQELLDKFLVGRTRLRVLEAGCGSSTYLKLGDGVSIVGIDIEQAQLDRNTQLDEKILGDIQTYELPEEGYDIVVCWDVLEHLPRPDLALATFLKSVKPDGLIVIAVPNLYSIKGLVTRFTPHWFHVGVYRYLFRSPNAGRPGHGPFRTYLRKSVAPSALRSYYRKNDLVEELFQLYPSTTITGLKQHSKFIYVVYSLVHLLSRVLTLGRYGGNDSDVIAVFRKPAKS